MASAKHKLYWYRRYGYDAMVEQNYIGAARWCVKALIENGFKPADCANLAFILFGRCSRTTQVAMYDLVIAAGLRDVRSPAAIFLRLSFELALGGGEPDTLVRNDYIKGILGRQIKNRPARPILFWHVPKCSGTSLNEALSAHFYGTALANVWPGYTYKPLVKYLLKHALQDVPYASSVHLGVDDLAPGSDHFAYTVLRDPRRRCYSMYRQEMAANLVLAENKKNWHHYRSYARYGEFWNYRRDHDFASWLRNIPAQLMCRQLSTFSAKQDVQQACQRISGLDYCFFRDMQMGSEAELFELLGVQYQADTVPKDLNGSDKTIPLPSDAAEQLDAILVKEYQLVTALSQPVSVA